MDKHKIAKALGLKIYDQNRKDFYYLGKVAQCSIVRLADYLASPAGEKAVEKQVEKLWCDEKLERFVRVDSRSDGCFEICLMHETASPYPEDDARYIGPTKQAAFCAALEWLTEKLAERGD